MTQKNKQNFLSPKLNGGQVKGRVYSPSFIIESRDNNLAEAEGRDVYLVSRQVENGTSYDGAEVERSHKPEIAGVIPEEKLEDLKGETLGGGTYEEGEITCADGTLDYDDFRIHRYDGPGSTNLERTNELEVYDEDALEEISEQVWNQFVEESI